MSKKNIIVVANQTIFDIAIQEHGSIESLFELLQDNTIESVNEDVEAGEVLVINSDDVILQPVVDLYISKSIKPASADGDFIDEEIGGAFTSGFTIGFEI